MSNEPVLCYVSGACAYFTTQALADQWGDDWDDAPYEHNAGGPYHWRPEKWDRELRQNVPNDEPRWDITVVYFEADLAQPCDGGGLNSPYSVQDINAGRTPWLFGSRWSHTPGLRIDAGTPLSEFKRLIWHAGGRVYVEEPRD